MKRDTTHDAGNAQSICEGVAVVRADDAVVRADDAEDAGERKRARQEGDTDHGCPSSGVKSGFSTMIEP